MGAIIRSSVWSAKSCLCNQDKKKRMIRMRRVSESCLWPVLHDNSHRCRDSRCKDFCKHFSSPISVMWQLTQGNILEHLLGPFSCPLTSNESLKWLMLCKFKTRRNEMSVAILIRGQVTLNGSCWRFTNCLFQTAPGLYDFKFARSIKILSRHAG